MMSKVGSALQQPSVLRVLQQHSQTQRDVNMLKNLTPNPIRVVARDRRRAAVHEAGHLVIARMLSIDANAYIYYAVENEDFDLVAEKTWHGQTCTRTEALTDFSVQWSALPVPLRSFAGAESLCANTTGLSLT
jgi:hypothetical protein